MKENGFTIIEILVAVTLLAIISLLVWQSTGTLLASKSRFEKKDDLFQGGMLALDLMTQDLKSAVLYSKIDFLGSSGAGEQRTKSVFMGYDEGDQDKIVFHTLSHVRYMKEFNEGNPFFIPYEAQSPRS